MAALSVHHCGLAMINSTFRAWQATANCSRKLVFAATPPPDAQPFCSGLFDRRQRFGDQAIDDSLFEPRRDVGTLLLVEDCGAMAWIRGSSDAIADCGFES